MYADLGPLSYGKKKPLSSVVTIRLDDDRIEYAQLNTRISAKSEKDRQQTSNCPESSSGILAKNLMCELRIIIYLLYFYRKCSKFG